MTLGDPNKGVDVDKFVTAVFGIDVNEVEKFIDEAIESHIADHLVSMTRLALRLTLNSRDPEAITEEVVETVLGETSNEDDEPGVSSSVKDLLELQGEFAKLNAKIDNLTQYHKTGKWPDN